MAVIVSASVVAQETSQKRYVEKVQVRVRSVLVFVTGAKGIPLRSPPRPEDFTATEAGAPVQILAIEPLSRASTPASAGDASSKLHADASPFGVPQYLYLDTTALNRRSMPQLARALNDSLRLILTSGPLEIIAADPRPRVLVPSTRDEARLRAAIAVLPKQLTGKERLLSIRREALLELREALQNSGVTTDAVRSRIRMNVSHELALLKDSLGRLEEWAAARSDERAGVLYLCNDGFDADPLEIYREAVPRNAADIRREVFMLSSEFAAEVPRLLRHAERTLAGKGLTTMPIAIGGVRAEYVSEASGIDTRRGNVGQLADGTPLFYFSRPLEPLRLIADATGGQVATSSATMRKGFENVVSAFILTFRAASISDGRAHELAIRSLSPDLSVRAPKFLLTGSPASMSAHRAIRTLETTEGANDFQVSAALEELRVEKAGRSTGMLRIAASFGAVRDVLDAGNVIPLRLSIAVEVTGASPFTSTEEVDWNPDSSSWRFQLPMTWPSDATRIAVLVEELSTGLSGSVLVAIPKR